MKRLAVVVVLATITAIGAAIYFLGLRDLLADPRGLEAVVERAGLWAPVAYVTLFALLEPFGFPGIVLIACAMLTWSLPAAFLLSWLGAISAGLVALGLARLIGRDWIEARMPARLRVYDQRLSERPLRTVILVRLLFFLSPLAHWFLGLSRVPVPQHVLGSAIGFAPGMALTVFAGESVVGWTQSQPAWMWLVIAAAVLTFILIRRARARSLAPIPVEPAPPDAQSRRDEGRLPTLG